MKNYNRLVLVGLLSLFLGFGVAFVFQTKPFAAPDERGHYLYIKTIIEDGRLPALTDKPINKEAHQPPLYYLVNAPAYAAVRGWSAMNQVYALRLLALLISAGVIGAGYYTARKIFSSRPEIAHIASAIIALNPQFIFMSGVINNDALANLLGALAVALTTAIWLSARPSGRQMVLACLLVAGLILTKLSLWPFGLLLAVALVVKTGREQWGRLFLTGLLPLVALGWWIGRNIALYQDPILTTTLHRLWYDEQHRDFLSPAGVWRWSKTLYDSFWARFGYFNIALPAIAYFILELGWVAALVGLVKFAIIRFKQLDKNLKQLLVALSGAALFLLAGVFYYSVQFYQPQGRYLFPALVIIGLGAGCGLNEMAPRRLRWVLFGIMVLLFVLLDGKSLALIARYG